MFVDYNTNPPTTVCLPLEAHARGARVLHPDVVWDYSSGLHVVVVYESDFNGQQGIWSEAWQYNPGTPNLMTSYGSFGGMEPVQVLGGEVTPNIDADVSGRGMIVWEWGGDIYAKGIDMTSPAVFSNLFRVSDCAGVNAREPDVSIRQIDRSESHISFVFVTQIGGLDQAVVAMPTFTNVISLPGASAAGICGNPDYYHEIRVPIAYTSLHKPRVALPWYLDSDNYFSSYPQRSNNTSVVYEVRDGADSYIASAQKWAYSTGGVQSGGSGGPWFVPLQTYSPPAIWPAGNGPTEWIGEILNANRVLSHPNFHDHSTTPPSPNINPLSLSPPTHDLNTDVSQTPVCAYTGDVHITAAWDWRDLTSSPSPRFGTDEILSRRIWLEWDETNRNFASGNPFYTPSVLFWMLRPTPTTRDYFVVGDGGPNGTRQTKISIAADVLATVYAFYDQDLQQIGFKLSPSTSTGAVRQAPPSAMLQASFQNNKQPSVYPNPARGFINIKGAQPGTSISLRNSVGQQVMKLDATHAEKHEIKTTDLASGLYFVTFTDMQGKVHYEKVVLQ